MNVERIGVPSFQNNGIRYSIVPRARALEQRSSPVSNPRDGEVLARMKKDAPTSYYVVLINRDGVTPEAPYRNPRTAFIDQGTIIETLPLRQSEGAAVVDVIGAVTGPYAAGLSDHDEWHGLLLVSREGKQVPTFGELDREEMTHFHGVIADILNSMSTYEGKKGFVGFSFSPLEGERQALIRDEETGEETSILLPRSPVQNIRSIHAHAVLLNENELHSTQQTEGKKFDMNMTHEPHLPELTEFFREAVFAPVAAKYQDLGIQYCENLEHDQVFPKGSFILMDKGKLRDPAAAGLIQDLHYRATELYSRIADTVVDFSLMKKGLVRMRGRAESQRRLSDLFTSDETLNSLSTKTKMFFRMFARMKDPNVMLSPDMPLNDRSRISESLVLLGLAYNIVYYYPEAYPNKVAIAIEPRWISGASPIETLGIFKDQYQMDTEKFGQITIAHMRLALAMLGMKYEDRKNRV